MHLYLCVWTFNGTFRTNRLHSAIGVRNILCRSAGGRKDIQHPASKRRGSILSTLPRSLHGAPWYEYKTSTRIMRRVAYTTRRVTLRRRIPERACSRTLRSSDIPLINQPFMRTDFCMHAFQFSVPSVCNSLPQTLLSSVILCLFLNPDLKLCCPITLFTEH